MTTSRLHLLSYLGQSVWIDYQSRDAIRDGELERYIHEDAVVGATSNPTIFEKAMTTSEAYQPQLRELADRTQDPVDIFWSLATQDVAEACDLFRPVWERSERRDGYVSLEVDPRLAYDVLGTFEQAIALHEQLDRPNLMVKIPATKPGLAALEDVIARGRSVNVTLIFSLQRYSEVVEAYVRGLERLVAAGGDPTGVASVASFFVSRIDTECDRRLDELGGHDNLKGQLAVANARLAHQRYLAVLTSPRWEQLASRGATPQRLLWASTSTKNPAYRDTVYVEELIGGNTVNTMPPETIRAFQDHGQPQPRLEHNLHRANSLLDSLARAGVDYDDLTETLEREGIDKFTRSFEQLISSLEQTIQSVAHAA